jgi:DNA-binding SARP family transcriptional activator
MTVPNITSTNAIRPRTVCFIPPPFRWPDLAIVREAATRSLRARYGPRLVDFRILGPLEVVGEAGALRLGGRKRRAALAILLLNANRVVSIDRLADDLYGDAPPATVVTQLQAHISQLRRLLDPDHPAGAPGSLLETREPGYLIRVAPEQVDLHRFERLTEEALRALAAGDAQAAATGFRRALDLWHGPALADLADEPFAQPAVARLEELRLAALEHRIEAELALGRQLELVGELETLVREHPFQERLRGQLMLALYRSGRQTDALAAYRDARRVLVESFGVDPTPALQELERAILRQDPELEPAPTAARVVPADERRALLVVEHGEAGADVQLQLANALAARAERELIVVRLVEDEKELAVASAELNARRRAFPAAARVAAFVSQDTAEDVVRLARVNAVELVLLGAALDHLARDAIPNELAAVFERSPADVGVVVGDAVQFGPGGGVDVPFGGGEHDWAALELAAWLASAAGMSLRLLGTAGDTAAGRRDASRLLADASLAVQRAIGVESEPVLVEPAAKALVQAVENAAVVVVGVAERWRAEGLGQLRHTLVRDARPPLVLIHRGLRPGGLAPRETSTRFTWSIER